MSLSQSMIVWAQRQLYRHSSHCFAIFYHLAATQSLLLEQITENKAETSVASLAESITW